VGLSGGRFVLHIHVVKIRKPRTRRQPDDLAPTLDRSAFFERTHFSGLEPTGTHPYDRRTLAVRRLAVEEDDVETVSFLSILFARRLFAHDALLA
jgi:hypothetical protein